MGKEVRAARRRGDLELSLHSPKAQSLRSFFCILASKLSVKYSCDNAGGSEQRRLANLSSTTRWIFRGRKGKKSKDSETKFSPFPDRLQATYATVRAPHQPKCSMPPTTWWQGNNRLVLYDMHTHTHTTAARMRDIATRVAQEAHLNADLCCCCCCKHTCQMTTNVLILRLEIYGHLLVPPETCSYSLILSHSACRNSPLSVVKMFSPQM